MERKIGACLCGGPEKVKTGTDGKQYIEVCPLHVKVRGTHPQTGEAVDEARCAIAWLPMLLIENSALQRGTGAAVESLRNEVVQRQEAAIKMARALGSGPAGPEPQYIEARIVNEDEDNASSSNGEPKGSGNR